MKEVTRQFTSQAPALTIVLDTNIWLSEHMLRHSSGSAFRFFLRSQNARLAVPEVVRREVEINLAKQLAQTATKVREDHAWMLRVLGSLRELVLPSEDELRIAATSAIQQTRIDVFDVPFSLNSATASFEKTLLGLPPSGPKDQQFKDGVIWADCLRLAEDGPVHLVSTDKGFYEAKEYTKGLASNLRTEAAGAKFEITLSNEIQSVLKRLQTDISVDYDAISGAFLPNFGGVEIPLLEREGFVLGPRISGSHQLFATDDPSIAHIEFTLAYECIRTDGSTGVLTAVGEGSYAPETRAISAIQSRGSELEFESEEGKNVRRHIVFGVMAAFLGHRTLLNEIRAPLPTSGTGS